MLVLQVRFPAGRYHATPWAAHVNEGEVEWPPSPWRLARALLATWHLKLRDEVSDETMHALLVALSERPPSYVLPTKAVGAHTRHYMPSKGGKMTKVFDAFLHVGKEALLEIVWDVELANAELQAMRRLATSLSYLGRAESWADASIAHEPTGEVNVIPLDPTVGAGRREELVRLIAPQPEAQYLAWRAAEVGRRVTGLFNEACRKAEANGKKPPTKPSAAIKRKVDELLPSGLRAVLEADTGALRKAGWNMPPGSQWIDYVRPKLTKLGPERSEASVAKQHTVARYAVSSSVRPLLTDVLSVADRLHKALVSVDQPPVFTGTVDGANGPERRTDGHNHAFIIPEANGRDGRITHITVYAREGFDNKAVDALRAVRRLWGREGKDIRLVLLGLGDPEDFGGLKTVAGQSPALATSKVWVSRTPFVSTLHPKVTRSGEKKFDEHGVWKGSPEFDLRRLIAQRPELPPYQLESAAVAKFGDHERRWLEFHLHARGHRGGRRGPSLPTGFRITFEEPVTGPLAFGYGAHFGLGYFVPAELAGG